MPARVSWNLRWRLSVLWALQWSITGAILTYLPLYFSEYLSRDELGQLMAVTAVGLWVAPFVVGQVCDRWLASEKYLAISHFVGGLTLISIPIATQEFNPDTGENFTPLLLLMGLYAVAYFPTVPLATALSFRHLPDPDSQFGKVRIWGTVGWVLAGLLLSLWLGRDAAHEWLVANFPQWQQPAESLQNAMSWMSAPSSSDCFYIAAVLSFALSSFCVFLPSTPPARSKRGTIAPLQTLKMFRNPTFSMLIAVSFLLAMVVPFYTLEVPQLLVKKMGFSSNWVPALMTIGQISEFPALLLLPMCLKRFGLKATFALGMSAWFLRYAMFAFADSKVLILTGIAFHGVCHVFIIIVIQLYVDSKCRSDLRASAQNLFAFITMGIAMPLGFLISGKLGDFLTDAKGVTNYHALFSIPAAVVLLLLVVYCKWFRLEMPIWNPSDSESADPPADPLAGDAPGLTGSE